MLIHKSLRIVGLFLAIMRCQGFVTPRNTHAIHKCVQQQPNYVSKNPTYLTYSSGARETSLKLAFPSGDSISTLARSLFSYSGNVPLCQSLGLNALLFTLLRGKLLKILTPEGFIHACALGTGLWATLGWRGWTLCVSDSFEAER